MELLGNPKLESDKLDFEFTTELKGYNLFFAEINEGKDKFIVDFNPSFKQERRNFDTIRLAKNHIDKYFKLVSKGIDLIENQEDDIRKESEPIVLAFKEARIRAEKENRKIYVIIDIDDIHVCSYEELNKYIKLINIGVTEIIHIAHNYYNLKIQQIKKSNPSEGKKLGIISKVFKRINQMLVWREKN